MNRKETYRAVFLEKTALRAVASVYTMSDVALAGLPSHTL